MRVLELEMQDINNFYIANKVEKLTQNDDLQFIKLTFPNSLRLDTVELVVNYITTSNLTITEVYSNLSKVFEFEINKKAVEEFGTLNVEFALREKVTKKYITHNKRIELQVMSDVNGSKATIVAGTTLNELLKQMDLKKKEFDDNFKTKIDSLNPIIQEMAGPAIDEAIQEAIQSSKDGIQAVGNEQVQRVEATGNGVVETINNAATQAANNAATEANRKVVEQQGISVKAVTDEATKQTSAITKHADSEVLKVTAEGNKQVTRLEETKTSLVGEATTAINQAKEGAINGAKETIKSHVDTEVKSNIDSYVTTTSKTEIDNHVDTVSKVDIDNYVTAKEEQIKGATYTPAIDEAGNLSFTNDKSLPNPPVVNIKGPKGEDGVNGNDGTPGAKGEKGDTPVKGVDYYTEQEKQEFAQSINSSITAEGNKQVKAVQNQGTVSLETIINIQKQIEQLLKNQEAIGNALSLNGKTGVQYDKEIQGVAGGYSGNFPLTSAVLDGIYLVPQTGKFYVCTKAFSGKSLSAPDDNFEELSVYKNRDKLSNLSGMFETYDKASDAALDDEPYLTLSFNAGGVNKTKYIGLTKDLTSIKAGMLHFKLDGIEYALRKNIVKSFENYMSVKYPNTYQSIKEITPDMIEYSSDVIKFKAAFAGCSQCTKYPLIDTSKAIDMTEMYNGYPYITVNATFPEIDTSNVEVFTAMYQNQEGSEEFPQLNTRKGKKFNNMYEKCRKAKKVSDIDLSSVIAEDITNNNALNKMLLLCNSLPSVTFNNVPKGITVEQMRTATSAPLTCEIILNYRSE